MCRAFNFSNPVEVEAIMEYLTVQIKGIHCLRGEPVVWPLSLRVSGTTRLMVFRVINNIINNTVPHFPPFLLN